MKLFVFLNFSVKISLLTDSLTFDSFSIVFDRNHFQFQMFCIKTFQVLIIFLVDIFVFEARRSRIEISRFRFLLFDYLARSDKMEK